MNPHTAVTPAASAVTAVTPELLPFFLYNHLFSFIYTEDTYVIMVFVDNERTIENRKVRKIINIYFRQAFNLYPSHHQD